jgi:predicted RNA-binding Zn ribbon-like protein
MLQDPGNRERAPEPLRLVQAFVNTLDIENGIEELHEPAALDDVLDRIGAWGGTPVACTEDDLRRALELREALRCLLLANNGLPVDEAAGRTVERVARTAHLGVRIDGAGRARLVAEAPGVDGALGGIVAVAFTAMADGSWARLKACRRDVCHWVYYDRSRNRSSTWCSMLVCGNRTKAKTYRRARTAAGRAA